MSTEERAAAITSSRAVLRAAYEDTVSTVMRIVRPTIEAGSAPDRDEVRAALILEIVGSAHLGTDDSILEAIGYAGRPLTLEMRRWAERLMIGDIERRLMPGLSARLGERLVISPAAPKHPFADDLGQQKDAELAARVAREYTDMTGESIDVEWRDGQVYAFGSEDACLMLFRRAASGRVGRTESVGRCFFAVEAPLTVQSPTPMHVRRRHPVPDEMEEAFLQANESLEAMLFAAHRRGRTIDDALLTPLVQDVTHVHAEPGYERQLFTALFALTTRPALDQLIRTEARTLQREIDAAHDVGKPLDTDGIEQRAAQLAYAHAPPGHEATVQHGLLGAVHRPLVSARDQALAEAVATLVDDLDTLERNERAIDDGLILRLATRLSWAYTRAGEEDGFLVDLVRRVRHRTFRPKEPAEADWRVDRGTALAAATDELQRQMMAALRDGIALTLEWTEPRARDIAALFQHDQDPAFVHEMIAASRYPIPTDDWDRVQSERPTPSPKHRI